MTSEPDNWWYSPAWMLLFADYALMHCAAHDLVPSADMDRAIGEGRAGAFFCIYWGEVSEDSDGPMEWCRPVPPDEAEALAARCPELTLRAEPAHQEAFVKIGDGQIDGAEWQLVEQSLHAWSDQQPDILPTDLGLRITYLPSEAGQDTYQDVAVPFNGQPRG